VEIVRSSPHRTIRDVAADLGVNDKTLNQWVVQARRRALDPEGSMSDAAKRRLEQLEAENARLRKELDFQKKARAFIQQMRANRNGSQ
jgi:transposase